MQDNIKKINKKDIKIQIKCKDKKLDSIEESKINNKEKDIIYLKTISSFNKNGKLSINPIITNVYPILNLTFVQNLNTKLNINVPQKYNIPTEYEKPNIQLKSLDFRTYEEKTIFFEEERDLVDDMIKLSHEDFFRMKKISAFFRYGNLDSFHHFNSHISKLLRNFYNKFENIVNFRYDIYTVPLLKNHLYFLNFRNKEQKRFNFYKHNIEKINSYVNRNDVNMINKINLIKLNTTRELMLILKTYKNLGEKVDSYEKCDFIYYSYFNKKDDSQSIKIANEQERKAILILPDHNSSSKKETSVIMRIFGLRKKTIRKPIFGVDINDIIMKHLKCHLIRNPFKFEKRDNLLEKILKRNKRTEDEYEYEYD